MAASMASSTSTSKEAALLVNRVPVKAFAKLLQRVIQRLTTGERFFNDAELGQLRTKVGVSHEELTKLVDFCAFIFEQSAYSVQRPENLEKSLCVPPRTRVDEMTRLAFPRIDLGIDAEHAQLAGQVWGYEATEYVDRLRDRHLVGPAILQDSRWEVHLNMAESPKTLRKDPTAIFEFDVAARDTPAAAPLSVECSHAELYGFFLNLQDIQAAIDDLAS